MTARSTKSSRINKLPRCAHVTAAGRRCRTLPASGSDFCRSHAKADAEELATTLTDGLDDFTSAATINDFLSRLLLLLAQDRLPPRRGAVMAYTANLLLHTLPAIDRQNAPPPTIKLPPRVIWTIPGPPRENFTPEELAAQKQSFMAQPTPNANP